MSTYTPVIGLEIHAELKTATKMFCRSKNDPDETRPNQNICPVCMAHPGTLPVINREAVRQVLRVGLALNATLADYTEFDRKNYFYPDLPKGYQLSQYEYPLVARGELNGVAITRVHLEEDTASSIHVEGEGTTIDYNRAGVPLMELVTEPVITSAKQAGDFARELQLVLRYLGASDANMEKGEMRVEANVSVSTDNVMGTKVEIKNLNSFRAMERAVDYEIKRQTKMLERGEQVVQETRGWDEGKQATFPQRIKEGSADYRYFPDPDLPSLKLSELPEFAHDTLRASLPELPSQRRERYLAQGIRAEDAEIYVRDAYLGGLFEEVTKDWAAEPQKIQVASNFIANDLVSIMSSNSGRDIDGRDTDIQAEMVISAVNVRKIVDLFTAKKISSRSAKDLLADTAISGSDPEVVAREKDLFQVTSAGDLHGVVLDVLEKNARVVDDYVHGKDSALEYLLGQCMRSLRGAGDPVMLRDLIKQAIAART